MFRYFLSEEASALGLALRAPRPLDAGFDLPSLEEVTIEPLEQARLRTGIHIAVPEGWVALVRDRSSVALRGGVTVAGVIDSAYRGEVQVLMYNLSAEPLSFKVGERIAQLVVVPHLPGTDCEEVSSLAELGDTQRGEGGFGSTGA